MAMLIDQDSCIQCGLCLPECPNESIYEEGGSYIITTDVCTECEGLADGPSCVAVCPVDCIDKDPIHVEDYETLYQKYLKLTQ